MILVTGTTGFIGQHLLKALVRKFGANKILALTSAETADYSYLLHYGYSFDDNYFISSGYDNISTIIHAGAFIPKSSKEINDWKGCNANIINTNRLLNAKLPALKQIVFLSSVDVYADSEIVSEETLTKPNTLYGQSKIYCEKMISAWANKSAVKCAILRIGHVYGPGEEHYQKLIPVTMKKLISGETLELWGTGEETRSFIYVDDVVENIICSLDMKEDVGPVNVVGAEQIAVRDLINTMIELKGDFVKIDQIEVKQSPRNLIYDRSKMIRYLISEQISLRKGLETEWKYMKSLLS